MTQWIVIAGGYLGPYDTVEILPDRLRCNGGAMEAQLDVIGPYTITGVEPAASVAAKQARAAEAARIAAVDDAAKGDSVFAQLLTKTSQEIDDWFAANVTTLAQARSVQVRMAKRLIRLERKLNKLLE